jgi:hypothetical protein
VLHQLRWLHPRNRRRCNWTPCLPRTSHSQLITLVPLQDRTINLWQLINYTPKGLRQRNDRTIKIAYDHANCIALSPDCSHIAATLDAARDLSILSCATDAVISRTPHQHPVGSSVVAMHWTANAAAIVTCGDSFFNVFALSAPPSIQLSLLKKVSIQQMGNFSLAVSPDSRFVTVGTGVSMGLSVFELLYRQAAHARATRMPCLSSYVLLAAAAYQAPPYLLKAYRRRRTTSVWCSKETRAILLTPRTQKQSKSPSHQHCR